MNDLLVNIIEHEMKYDKVTDCGDNVLMTLIDLGVSPKSQAEVAENLDIIQKAITVWTSLKHGQGTLIGCQSDMTDGYEKNVRERCEGYRDELTKIMRVSFNTRLHNHGVRHIAVDLDVKRLVMDMESDAPLSQLYFVYYAWHQFKPHKNATLVLSLEQACRRALQGN